MADGFERMVHDARAFFTDLRENNTRDWFEERKDRYTEDIRKPAEFFAGLIAEDIARRTGDAVKTKVFRIYRDVRFSKDKTPYKTHMHMMWTPVDAGPLTPKWFFGISPDYIILGLGVMGLQAGGITQYRAFVDSHGDDLQAALNVSGARLSEWGPDPLKRVPKPYAPDHPHADLLKRKSLALHADIPDDWEKTGLVKAVNTCITDLMPVYRVWTDA